MPDKRLTKYQRLPAHIQCRTSFQTGTGYIRCLHCGELERLTQIWQNTESTTETVNCFAELHAECEEGHNAG